MPNLYTTLYVLQNSDILGIPKDDIDVNIRVLQLLQDVSREIDKLCGRHFYPLTDTKYFTGIKINPREVVSVYGISEPVEGLTKVKLPDDLLKITTLKEDDGSGTYPALWTTSDYFLWPYDAKPEGPVDIVTPYSMIEVNTLGNGNFYVFRYTPRAYQLIGIWGYCNVTEDTGQEVDEAMSSNQITMKVQAGINMQVGWTCLIDLEQIFILSVSEAENICTIQRGVNGTTPATHTKDSLIYKYVYPGPIIEACIMQASRLWTRRASGYGTSFVEMTQAVSLSGLDNDVKDMLKHFIKGTSKIGMIVL